MSVDPKTAEFVESVGEALGVSLMPDLPVADLDDEQTELLERIDRLEAKFARETSGKKRYKTRMLIEQLEDKLCASALRQHNAVLRRHLEDQIERAEESATQLRAVQAQMNEIIEAIREAKA